MLVFGQSGCIWTNMILPEQGASDRAKVVVFLQSGCIRTKWLYSGKVVVFGQNGCVRAKVVVLR